LQITSLYTVCTLHRHPNEALELISLWLHGFTPQEILPLAELLDDAFLPIDRVRSENLVIACDLTNQNSACLQSIYLPPTTSTSKPQYRRTRLSENGILSGSAIPGSSNNVRATRQPDAGLFFGHNVPTSSRVHHLELLQGSRRWQRAASCLRGEAGDIRTPD
jgi:hypothetical protein